MGSDELCCFWMTFNCLITLRRVLSENDRPSYKKTDDYFLIACDMTN